MLSYPDETSPPLGYLSRVIYIMALSYLDIWHIGL